MKPTKTYADLLREIFSEYQKENPLSEVYEAYQNSYDMCKVVRLKVENCPSWATPVVILKQWGNNTHWLELSLSATAPKPGYNEEMRGGLFTLHSTLNSANEFWGTPERSMGGISRMMIFDNDSDIVNNLIVELIVKAQRLSKTGIYGLSLFTAAMQEDIV